MQVSLKASYHHLDYPSPSPFSTVTLSPVRRSGAISVRSLSFFQVNCARWRKNLSFVSSKFGKNTRSQPEELYRRRVTQVSLLCRAGIRTSKFTSKRNSLQKCLSSGGSPLFPPESVGNKNQYKQGTRLNSLTSNSLLHWTESRETTK